MARMHRDLSISPKPVKSSNLTLPPSPFSPRFPITPPPSPPRRSTSLERKAALRRLDFTPPPPDPLRWLWQCHLCNRCYQLGVTRRCLDDGHYFCAGTTTVKRSKRGSRKVVRHRACASEFDYQGWKVWGNWRRSVIEQAEAAVALQELLEGDGLPVFLPPSTQLAVRVTSMEDGCKDCWSLCDYPSECRWGRQHGVVESPPPPSNVTLPTVVTVPSSVGVTPPPQAERKAYTDFDELLLDDELVPVDFDQLVPRTPFVSPEEETKKPSVDELLASAKRRKRRSAGFVASPLASNPPSSEAASPSTAQALQKAFDDFELDFRKSFGKAGAFVSSVVTNTTTKRNSTALDKEAVGLRVGRKKSAASFS